MAFEKGKEKTGGRAKGVPNKDKAAIRDAFQLLLENNIDKMDEWLTEIAKSDPYKAFEVMVKIGEFVVPKLSRSEVTDVTSLEQFLKMTPEERRSRIIEINNTLKENENGKFKNRARRPLGN